MDTTFPDNAARYRAIDQPWMWHVAYWLIILGEAMTAVLLGYGALKLWQARRAQAMVFARASGGPPPV